MKEFMDGWKWWFRYDSSRHKLHFNAWRHEYTVKQPIVDPTNRLILNFYPNDKRVGVIENLKFTDTSLFASV